MKSYRKSLAKGSFEYQFYKALGFPPVSEKDEAPVVIRITLGDMDLLDGFYMPLPANVDKLSIEEAIREHVLCKNQEDRLRLKKRLSDSPNPDLVDIYNALLSIYEHAEAGTAIISYHINNGDSNIQPGDPVSLHQQFYEEESTRGYHLLDLVLEVYDNADPFSRITEKKELMLREFRGIFILYLMDKFGYQPKSSESNPELEDHIYALLDYLSSEGMIHIEGEDKAHPVLSNKGKEFLKDIVYEAEFYIDNYDIFGDVHVRGFDEIRFNTGYGDNLIVPVFINDGIDPYRALFISALYLGNMDVLTSNLMDLYSEDTFRKLFSLIADSPTKEDIGAKFLDRVVFEGKRIIEEQNLREARIKHIESIKQRIDAL